MPRCSDIFVPGIFGEDGDASQFSSIISTDAGRGYIALQYNDDPVQASSIDYDQGVTDASNALNELLYALQQRFSDPDIRVFGHGKGSDAVTRVSLNSDYTDIPFYAFGQPGRTQASLLGDPGNIQKLSNNLVGITWQNDEVQFYGGSANGSQLPQNWGYPGFINSTGDVVNLSPFRIDHHNSYGSDTTQNAFPYCATGDKSAMTNIDECKQQDGVQHVANFWGDSQCTDIVHDMMSNAAIGDRHYIGFSGPRADNCKDTVGTIEVEYELTYLINIADQNDCQYNLNLEFKGLNEGADRADGDTVSVSSVVDTNFITDTGTIQIPYHMRLELNADMVDVSGPFSSCVNFLGANSEAYIETFAVSFTHPVTNEAVTRTLIGNSEGIEYLNANVAGEDNTGWNKVSGIWDMFFMKPSAVPTHQGAIVVSGATAGGNTGSFFKQVHLVD